MRVLEKEYYVYDKKNREFITTDGDLAVVGESFKREMLDINSSFLIFIDKIKYNKHEKNNSVATIIGKGD